MSFDCLQRKCRTPAPKAATESLVETMQRCIPSPSTRLLSDQRLPTRGLTTAEEHSFRAVLRANACEKVLFVFLILLFLQEYVKVLICNKKTKEQVQQDLISFLEEAGSKSFSDWYAFVFKGSVVFFARCASTYSSSFAAVGISF